MIKFTVLYPNHEKASFDFEYYKTNHLALTYELLGKAILKSEIEKGISGAGGVTAPYVAIGHLYFDSIEMFRTSFLPNIEKLRSDTPNFTNTQPVVQISEVLL